MEGDGHRHPRDHEAPDALRGEASRRARAGLRRRLVVRREQPALRGAAKDPLDHRHRGRLRRGCRIVDRHQRLLVPCRRVVVVARVVGGVAEQRENRPGPRIPQALVQQRELRAGAASGRHPFLHDPGVQHRHRAPGSGAECIAARRLREDRLEAAPRLIEVARRERRPQRLCDFGAGRPRTVGSGGRHPRRERRREEDTKGRATASGQDGHRSSTA